MRLAIVHLALFGEVCGGGGMEILQEKRWACFVPGAKGGTGNSQQALYRHMQGTVSRTLGRPHSDPPVRKSSLPLTSTYSLQGRYVCGTRTLHSSLTDLVTYLKLCEICWQWVRWMLRFYFNRYSFSKHIPLKRVTYLTYKWISHL